MGRCDAVPIIVESYTRSGTIVRKQCWQHAGSRDISPVADSADLQTSYVRLGRGGLDSIQHLLEGPDTLETWSKLYDDYRERRRERREHRRGG